MDYAQDNDDGYPGWWDEKATRQHKGEWVDGAESYIDVNEVNVEDMEFNEAILKKMLPHIAAKDKRWKQFPLKRFDSERHNLHRALFDAVKARVQQMKAQSEMLKRQLEAERQALQVREEK